MHAYSQTLVMRTEVLLPKDPEEDNKERSSAIV